MFQVGHVLQTRREALQTWHCGQYLNQGEDFYAVHTWKWRFFISGWSPRHHYRLVFGSQNFKQSFFLLLWVLLMIKLLRFVLFFVLLLNGISFPVLHHHTLSSGKVLVHHHTLSSGKVASNGRFWLALSCFHSAPGQAGLSCHLLTWSACSDSFVSINFSDSWYLPCCSATLFCSLIAAWQ